MHDKHHLIFYPDSILRKKGEAVDEVSPFIQNFVQKMKEVCVSKKGLGIAAPQVNESLNIFVSPVTGVHSKTKECVYATDYKDWTVVINPKIIGYSKEAVLYEEGCLSLPKLYSTVIRPKSIEVTYQDLHMQTHTKVLTHWFARIFLHEYDHLQGILFTDYLLGSISNGIEQETTFGEKMRISKTLSDLEQVAKGI
ncbi:MAG: peptide deformylase [Chlamydiia bacterium]